MGKTYRAVGYVRVAHLETSGDNAVENQVMKIEDFISKRKDLQLTKIFLDCGIRGLSFGRDGLNKLMNDVRANNIDCIIAYNVLRLGRNIIGVSNFILDNFTKNNIEFISIKDNFDSEGLPFLNQMFTG